LETDNSKTLIGETNLDVGIGGCGE